METEIIQFLFFSFLQFEFLYDDCLSKWFVVYLRSTHVIIIIMLKAQIP